MTIQDIILLLIFIALFGRFVVVKIDGFILLVLEMKSLKKLIELLDDDKDKK